MAFEQNISVIDDQIMVPNAYLKIVSANVTTIGISVTCDITMYAYKDKEAADNELPPLKTYTDKFTPEFGENVSDIKKQGYNYLKTKLEFADVIDIIETYEEK
ncbi:hypothetical protein WKH57_25765 [Niallia taxi]|uniref:hypothetical protein n=1 Tax=Niallia taxi TaxID=2499688 RepID=UPI00317438AE